MKKILVIIICAIFSVSSVNALTLNEDGTYTNEKGAIITSDEYNTLSKMMNKKIIDLLSQKAVKGFTNPNNTKKPIEEFSITTDIMDKTGNILNSITIEATEEEAKSVANNKNLHVLSDGKLHDISKEPVIMPLADWEVKTASKRVRMSYYPESSSGATAYMDVLWYTVPNVKKFDIMAMRWTTSRATSNITDYAGFQSAFDKDGNFLQEDYYMNNDNLKITSTGIGQIADVFDNVASDLEMGIYFEVEKNCGEWMYATYQHARNSKITLAGAKSYTFSSSGLGGVLYFSNSTTRSYYDAMAGVKDDLSSGGHFIW